MKYFLISILILISFIFTFSVNAQLQTGVTTQINKDLNRATGGIRDETVKVGGTGSFSSVLINDIGTMVGNFLAVIGVIGMCFVLYGGYMWVTAAGNAERAKQARGIVVNSVIAIIVIGLAYLITEFIIDIYISTLVEGEKPAADAVKTTEE